MLRKKQKTNPEESEYTKRLKTHNKKMTKDLTPDSVPPWFITIWKVPILLDVAIDTEVENCSCTFEDLKWNLFTKHFFIFLFYNM